MRFNFFEWFFAPTEKQLMEDHIDVYELIFDLQQRIEKLEEENIELTNCLYELENRLQAQIDTIHPVVYNIHQKE